MLRVVEAWLRRLIVVVLAVISASVFWFDGSLVVAYGCMGTVCGMLFMTVPAGSRRMLYSKVAVCLTVLFLVVHAFAGFAMLVVGVQLLLCACAGFMLGVLYETFHAQAFAYIEYSVDVKDESGDSSGPVSK